ncbi:hypothetical protein [Streptomyces alanosinicus]|uniref:Lipoprotein n=1 Tax=Streptomyces alanosinicus TaxID=68171 RepID=A0A918YPU1_9ACTN|nr:hypothetical protein [Streptomyces alanosinicus]GHE12165.1 hypothetical protein GCM10010339_74470 [Streptomyces alanosinicus]
MARRTLILTTVTATAALLLTACGGGGSGKTDDIKGADKGAQSPSPSATTATGGPDVSVPKDLNLVFDFAQPSDAKQAAALADAENYVRALKHGIAKQDPNDPAYQYYSGGQAAQYAKSQIQAWVKGGWAPTGTDKYYDSKVTTMTGGKRVLVSFCRNQAKFYGKEIKTGKVLYTKESLSSYEKFSLLMFPPSGSSHAWKAQVAEVAGKAKECQS